MEVNAKNYRVASEIMREDVVISSRIPEAVFKDFMEVIAGQGLSRSQGMHAAINMYVNYFKYNSQEGGNTEKKKEMEEAFSIFQRPAKNPETLAKLGDVNS
jgi:metal-responsive CopG/Arc/MetJ family transcriptional regulator